MEMIMFKPGIFVTETPMYFSIRKEPPKGMDFDPTFGFVLDSDPFPPKMIADLGPNEIVNSLNLTFTEFGQVSFNPDWDCKEYLKQMNHDQRWVMGCTLLYSLEKFIGEKMDEHTKYNMIMDMKKTLHYLAKSEIKPGQWDENY